METKKLSFEKWIQSDSNTIVYCPVDYAIDQYNEYQKYLQELEKKSLKWEDIMNGNKINTRYYINNQSNISCISDTIGINADRNNFPTKESAEQELARMQWIMIAYEANDGKVIEDGYYIYEFNSKIDFARNNSNDGNIYFKTKELCQQAYEENKEIVHTMLI